MQHARASVHAMDIVTSLLSIAMLLDAYDSCFQMNCPCIQKTSLGLKQDTHQLLYSCSHLYACGSSGINCR